MKSVLSIICFVMATLAFLNGFVTEYRQSRRPGPYAIVPTLPWAFLAALFVLFGLWFLPYDVPWWAYPLAFVVALITFGFAIIRATRHRQSKGE
jgi:hypothetical protein